MWLLYSHFTTFFSFFFFFNDTATTEIYTLSLHDALPILRDGSQVKLSATKAGLTFNGRKPENAAADEFEDRKSTRLNSSHSSISYAVFCLKKKKKKKKKKKNHNKNTNNNTSTDHTRHKDG